MVLYTTIGYPLFGGKGTLFVRINVFNQVKIRIFIRIRKIAAIVARLQKKFYGEMAIIHIQEQHFCEL